MLTLSWTPQPLVGGPPILTSLTRRETMQLRRLAQRALVVEIGSAYGFSTIVMAQVARRVIAIDPHEEIGESLEKLQRNLIAYGVEAWVDLILEPSGVAMPKLAADSADLVFIDGCHHESEVAQDVHEAMRVVRRGGHVAVHDYDEAIQPAIKPVCDVLLSRGRLVDTLWVWQK